MKVNYCRFGDVSTKNNIKTIYGPAEQLDAILKCGILFHGDAVTFTTLDKSGYEISEFIEYIPRKRSEFNFYLRLFYNVEIPDADIDAAIKYLIEEKMLSFSKDKSDNTLKYQITFKGKALIQMEGGYLGRLKTKDIELKAIRKREFEQMEIQRNTISLTVILTVGTAGSLIIQTLDLFETSKVNAIFLLSPLWALSAFFLLRYIIQKICP